MGVADSAKELADKYAADHKYVSLEERVETLIRVESAKSFAAGFVSGIGGLWTLPVAVPASVYANWVLQARIAGAIAHLYGHDLKTERIRSLCLLCLLGESAWGVLKGLGVRVIEKAARWVHPPTCSHRATRLEDPQASFAAERAFHPMGTDCTIP